MITRRASQACRRSRAGRVRRLLVATLAVALAAVALQLPVVAAGDVGPAATRISSHKLVSPQSQSDARFGQSVAIDGDELVAGVPFVDIPLVGDDVGMVIDFSWDGSSWTHESPAVAASDPDAFDLFGYAVALDEHTLVVGAYEENSSDGAAYVYEREGAEWVLQQKLVAPDPRPADAMFGVSVDVCGDTIVVGAPGEDGYDGAAYVFAWDGSAWAFEQRLSGSDAESDSLFGDGVATDGHRVVACWTFYPANQASGLVFAREGDTWSEEGLLTHGGGYLGSGEAVALSGDIVLVGARGSDAVLVYARTGDSWGLQQALTPTGGSVNDEFGASVDLEGETVVIGAAMDDEKGDGSGAAYVFERDGATWSQRDKLLASDGGSGDGLGGSVAMSGDVAVVGAPWDANQSGSAYVFDGILGPYNPVELAGATRYETAIAASQEAFPNGTHTVVIATGENWPDALGGAALAGAYDAPILLTLSANLPNLVVEEINRLEAEEAIILGGPGAVSPAVESALASWLGATNVRRIGGATRYDTADLIARAVRSKVGANYDGAAFVATGLNFPDALTGSPLAAAGPWPIFLAPATGMTPSTLATMSDIGVTDVLVLGGAGVVSQEIEDGLTSGVSGDVTRLAGPTRYETAVEVASYGVGEAGLRWNGLALATGENFPDALAGGPLQGRKESVMLLTHTATLTPATGVVLRDETDMIAKVRFLGGPGALSQTVRDIVKAILE